MLHQYSNEAESNIGKEKKLNLNILKSSDLNKEELTALQTVRSYLEVIAFKKEEITAEIYQNVDKLLKFYPKIVNAYYPVCNVIRVENQTLLISAADEITVTNAEDLHKLIELLINNNALVNAKLNHILRSHHWYSIQPFDRMLTSLDYIINTISGDLNSGITNNSIFPVFQFMVEHGAKYSTEYMAANINFINQHTTIFFNYFLNPTKKVGDMLKILTKHDRKPLFKSDVLSLKNSVIPRDMEDKELVESLSPTLMDEELLKKFLTIYPDKLIKHRQFMQRVLKPSDKTISNLKELGRKILDQKLENIILLKHFLTFFPIEIIEKIFQMTAGDGQYREFVPLALTALQSLQPSSQTANCAINTRVESTQKFIDYVDNKSLINIGM